jgi:hypothetical protein
MRDDYLSADWANSHGQFTTAFGALLRAISTAFERLNAIQFDAPWKHEPAIGATARRR